jgi:hypothetical protein
VYKREGEVNVNCPVAIVLIVQQSYGMGVEAVEEPLGPRLGAPLPLAMRQQRKQSIAWVAEFYGLSSDTSYYIGPGWQESWPQ